MTDALLTVLFDYRFKGDVSKLRGRCLLRWMCNVAPKGEFISALSQLLIVVEVCMKEFLYIFGIIADT